MIATAKEIALEHASPKARAAIEEADALRPLGLWDGGWQHLVRIINVLARDKANYCDAVSVWGFADKLVLSSVDLPGTSSEVRAQNKAARDAAGARSKERFALGRGTADEARLLQAKHGSDAAWVRPGWEASAASSGSLRAARPQKN